MNKLTDELYNKYCRVVSSYNNTYNLPHLFNGNLNPLTFQEVQQLLELYNKNPRLTLDTIFYKNCIEVDFSKALITGFLSSTTTFRSKLQNVYIKLQLDELINEN